MAQNKWVEPDYAPPPLFLGQKEKDLVKQVNDELLERVIGQEIYYYSIDVKTTNYHPLYGEAIIKNFLPPVRVYALVEWSSYGTVQTEGFGLDKAAEIIVHFHQRRLQEDQDVFVREGDFVKYDGLYYEIMTLQEPKQLFGQVGESLEVAATCKVSRRGLFDAS